MHPAARPQRLTRFYAQQENDRRPVGLIVETVDGDRTLPDRSLASEQAKRARVSVEAQCLALLSRLSRSGACG